MPIYEYEPVNVEQGCPRCREGFELVHPAGEPACSVCPDCGRPVRKLISRVRVVVRESDGESARIIDKVRGYENEGMWSHAAELADSHAAKAKDSGLKERALDNYKKAGLDPE
ncbi:MAG: zinc ribbon domain-containing protein [Desulfarculaceae bacterium]|nr:zinc ribbon domain-containing protein [Desulfarculaceae bacterium]MCF8047436.1 zinc ribbon domain-containing protein [Desulfarculaceae bacterium]MCF8065326.1 zinc ribbon domain-containing protein [Desulfarculaceae bacterium]MCF8098777.1 zinc ribbon domain-containing protein [Desulfarculaceae bacterium]MCF8122094.1 zinc ribbon domain-containing protein [Desulfarculaceae bacterium]